MGYITRGGGSGGGSDWIDDVIDHTIADETVAVAALGNRYVIASHGGQPIIGMLHVLTFPALGYTGCVPGDVGKPVVDAVTGTGTLVSYVNGTRTWKVWMLTPYTVGSNVTITAGTGAGKLLTDTTQGFIVATDVTAEMAVNDILRVRQTLNVGWYTVQARTTDAVNTYITTDEVPPSNIFAGSSIWWNITGGEWAIIGVDMVTVYDGGNWVWADTPTAGTTCLQTTLMQPIMFSGQIWYLFAATVSHPALANLLVGDSGHTQFVMLAGRAGSQSVFGGTLGTETLTLTANATTPLTSNILLADTGVTLHAFAATQITLTVGVGTPMTLYTTYIDSLTIHPTSTSSLDLGDATHVWQALYLEELRLYDTTGAEAAAITRSLTEFLIDTETVGSASFRLKTINANIQLGDLAGANHFTISNSTPVPVFQVTSLGIVSGLGVVVGYVGAADSGKLVALDGTGKIAVGFLPLASIDHNSLNNLAVGDVHTQYALGVGRAGGQTLQGGTIAGNSLTLLGDGAGTGSILLYDDLVQHNGKKLILWSNVLVGQQSFTDQYQATVETTDITPTNIVTIPINDVNTHYIEARVIGMKQDGTQRAVYHLSACVYRAGAGALIQGICLSHHTEESDVAYDCVITTLGNNALVQVTGVAMTHVHWSAHITDEVIT